MVNKLLLYPHFAMDFDSDSFIWVISVLYTILLYSFVKFLLCKFWKFVKILFWGHFGRINCFFTIVCHGFWSWHFYLRESSTVLNSSLPVSIFCEILTFQFKNVSYFGQFGRINCFFTIPQWILILTFLSDRVQCSMWTAFLHSFVKIPGYHDLRPQMTFEGETEIGVS